MKKQLFFFFVSVSPANTLLALILLTIHFTKRLYETQNVNVFSDAKMNIAHYLIGFLHYFSLIIIIIGESEGFVKGIKKIIKSLKKKENLINKLIIKLSD